MKDRWAGDARSGACGLARVAPREARIGVYLLGVAAWAVTGLVWVFAVAVAIAAFLATVTVIQRIAHMATTLNEKKG